MTAAAKTANREDYEPLLQDDGGYDYDYLEKEKSRKRRHLALILVVGTIVFAGLIVGIYLLGSAVSFSKTKNQFNNAAVASDVAQCSTIGKNILLAGGNAVDSAIAALLCMGLADAQSMGLGGGFFMTVYNRTTGKSFVVDAREEAPGLANVTMFHGNPQLSSQGPLSIAVPGEVKGYWLAHQHFGRLPWADLFIPAIQMAESGFLVPDSLASALVTNEMDIMNESSLRDIFVNNKTKQLFKKGELMTRPFLAKTLRAIALGGEKAFYDGNLTDLIMQDLAEIGSIISRSDLKNYTAYLKSPTEITLKDGLRVLSPPPPGSGALLSFMLNILDGYSLTSSAVDGLHNTILTMHRMVETWKFAYAKRTDLGDEHFVNVTALVANLTSTLYADQIRSMISNNMTHNVSYYAPSFYNPITTGTAHLSVVDAEGSAVSVTSTINGRFGSMRRGQRTGIIFNNEMDDFSSPNISNIFGLRPSPANFIVSGKRPLSSMCPAIFIHPDGSIRLIIGAAGGSYITTATAFVTAHELWLGETIDKAVSSFRIHHQLLPDYISCEDGFDKDVEQGLVNLGHGIQTVAVGKSIVQAVSRHNNKLFAVSDFRKGGSPDGY